jgi:hypothetical protein
MHLFVIPKGKKFVAMYELRSIGSFKTRQDAWNAIWAKWHEENDEEVLEKLQKIKDSQLLKEMKNNIN